MSERADPASDPAWDGTEFFFEEEELSPLEEMVEVRELMLRYEQASGNYVDCGVVYDSMGHPVCEWSVEMATEYLLEVNSEA